MAQPWGDKRMPKHLKATYLADQEFLLEETRATRLYYFPGPVLWSFVFGILTYLAWAPSLHLPAVVAFSDALSRLASAVHLSSSQVRTGVGGLFTVLFVAGLLWLGLRYLRWIRTVYAVTSRRVIVQKGIVSRDLAEIPVTQVRGVDVRQSVGQRILGYGTVRVSSEEGTRLGNEDWEGIPKPFKFQKLIEDATTAIQTPPRPPT